MKDRERYIDIVKGISILCIVLLHYENGTVLPHSINTFIGSFMITSFYVVVGWLSALQYKKRTIRELIIKRWQQLGIPYLWWTGIILLFDLILLSFGYYDIGFVCKEIYKSITLRGIGTLWFLPALFGGEIIWNYLLNKNRKLLMFLALVITLVYNFFYGKIFFGETDTVYRIIDAPFRSIYNISKAWIGIAFGYYVFLILKNNILRASNYLILIIGIFFFISAFCMANYLPLILPQFCYLFAPLFGPLGLLLIVKSIQQCKCLNFFNFCGINSLNIMVTHYSIIMVLFTIIVENFFNIEFSGWITITCFLFSLPIQYILVLIIDKYAKFILGKQ